MAARVIIFLATAAIFASSQGAAVQDDEPEAENRDYVYCNSQPRDEMLYQNVFTISSDYLSKVTFDLPVYTTPAIIHCVEATNLGAIGESSVVLRSGGVGYNVVNLHFESVNSGVIHYNVTLYGR